MDALQGHGEEGMSARYGRGFFIKKLAEAMGRLRYEGPITTLSALAIPKNFDSLSLSGCSWPIFQQCCADGIEHTCQRSA